MIDADFSDVQRMTIAKTLVSMEGPILLDGRLLKDGGAGTGVGQYARTTIAALRGAGLAPLVLDQESGPRRGRAARLLAALAPWPRTAHATPDGFRRRDVFAEAQVFFDVHRRPMPVIVPGPVGIAHWTYPLPLRIQGWRNLYTVHDVLPLDPSIPSPVDGVRLRRLLQSLHLSGGSFVTVSDAARAQIAQRMGWRMETVASCHQAVDVGHSDGALPVGFSDMVQNQDYLLFVGAVEARKNLHRLLDAYRASGISTPLVISGPNGLGADAIDAHIAATPGAIRLGLQPRATVLRLIAEARALVFVSLAEGFGLPVAEAMALGTPVLSADGAALTEVSGGAAVLVDPLDLAALVCGLRTIDGDEALRNDLVSRGAERARHFALAPYARRLLELYGEI